MLDLIRSVATGDPLSDRKAVPTQAGEPSLYATTGTPGRRLSNRAAGRHTEAYGGKDAIDWVADCVDLYAQTTSNAAYHFEKDGKVYKIEKSEEDPDDVGEIPGDLASLFTAPNPYCDWTEHVELAVIDLLLAGEFFWLKFRGLAADGSKPLALYRLAPPLIETEVEGSRITKYHYQPPGGGKPIEIAAKDVMHVKRPNPHDPYRGLGIIAGGPRMFDIELANVESQARYYEQGTQLTGVLETERSLPDATWKKVVRRFQGLYSGARNAHQVAALERGLKFKALSANAREAQFKEVSEWNRDRIAAAFRVPTPLLGVVGSSVDRQAAREAQRIFDNKTMRPFLNRLQSQITRGLTEAWGYEFVIDHEYVMPIEDKIDLAEAFAALPGVKLREVRKMVDLDPLGDERDDIVLNLPGQDREDGGHPDRPLDGEAGRPPKGENTRAFPESGKPLPPSADASAKAARDALADLEHAIEGVSD